MAKVYLVDSENIGASWSQLLVSMSKEDRMYVFYTDKSPYISYENLLQVIAHCEIPVFLKCYEGKNALDFQLVSELGFKLCQDPTAEFIIVSDDYGYDAAVRYWSERKYNVRRIGKKYCRPILPKKDNAAVQSEVRAIRAEELKEKTVHKAGKTLHPEIIQPVEEVSAAEEPRVIEVVPARENDHLEDNESSTKAIPYLEEVMNAPVVSEERNVQMISEEQDTEQVSEKGEQKTEEQSSVEQQIELPFIEEQVQKQIVAAQVAEEAQSVAEEQSSQETPQKSQKDNQTQKRSRDRRKKHKKEAAKEPDKATGTAAEEDMPEETPTVEEQEGAVKQQETEQEEVEAAIVEQNQAEQPENEEYKLDLQILDMVKRCGSPEPEKDARCVKELFCTLSMSNLTSVNNALTSIIGNELGNVIYRELKEHQECREHLDALYCPAVKNRFIHYVQIVLDRSKLEGITAEELGNFLLHIPRKNLNSIRSAMMKEFGHDLGAEIYTVFKAHIKVLNKI